MAGTGAHISGTFSDERPGRLKITLSGIYAEGTRRDAGFPASFGGDSNLVIMPFAGPAGDVANGPPIDRHAPTSVYELDYPGGSLPWTVGTVEVASQDPTGGGLWGYGWQDLRLILTLTKR